MLPGASTTRSVAQHGRSLQHGISARSPVIYEPRSRAPSAAVIWLHGLGADGHDFTPIVPELGAIREWTRFIFPHAPLRPVSINFGMTMRAWYDIRDEGDGFVSDADDLRASQGAVEALIEAEVEAGVPAERIVLAGFSQGGAVALQTALRHPPPPRGPDGALHLPPFAGTLASERSAANADIPVFMAHGEHDPLIGVDRALASRDVLLGLDYDVEWHTYPMPHAVCPDEIRDIAAWFARVVPGPGPSGGG